MLAEAAVSQSPKRLWALFTVLLHICEVSEPVSLWLKYRDALAEDFYHQAQLRYPSLDAASDNIYNCALIDVEKRTVSLDGNTLPTYGLPQPVGTERDNLPTELIRETAYDIDTLAQNLRETEPKLLLGQQGAYNTIFDHVRNRKGGIFFLDAPGRTGKTFVTKLLLAKVRQHKDIALAVASSGIAATLLLGGRTAHLAFKLPLNLATSETPSCNISKTSDRGLVLRRCQLKVWDECAMVHKRALEALDTILQDIRDCQIVMRGVTLLLSGDFQHTLPFIPKGTRADEVRACLKSSLLWQKVTTLTLTTNMRAQLHGNQLAAEFASDILSLGNGKITLDGDGKLSLSPICTTVNTVEHLKAQVFPSLPDNNQDMNCLCERATLAPITSTVNAINEQLLQSLPGRLYIYKSVNTVPDQDQAVNYPVEFLNSLEPPGLPPHRLGLKIGTPIMLVRNLDPPKLCNGTCLVIKKVMQHVVEATIISGCGKGEDVFVPRILLIPSGAEILFTFRRLQFPLPISFAMSINKSQGQTLLVAGLHLVESCFSHAQLYVGCSRVGAKEVFSRTVHEGKQRRFSTKRFYSKMPCVLKRTKLRNEIMLPNLILRSFRRPRTLSLSYRQLVPAEECLSFICHYIHQKTVVVNTDKCFNCDSVEDENSSNQVSTNNYSYFKSFIESTTKKELSQDVSHSDLLKQSVANDKGHSPDETVPQNDHSLMTETNKEVKDFIENHGNELEVEPIKRTSPYHSETDVKKYTDDSNIYEEPYGEKSDAVVPSVAKPSTVYRPMFIRQEPVYNLAFYVKESKTLQQLIHLGVDLSRIERVKGASDLILKLDFDSVIQPYLQFLMDNGVAKDDLGSCITKNPLLFEVDLNSLESNIGYLQSKKFTTDAIGHIITSAPRTLLMSVSAIDGKLGFYQKYFKLTGNKVRAVIARLPKLITYDVKAIKDVHFEMKEFLGFTNSDLQKIFLSVPKVYLSNKRFLRTKFEYLHLEMGLNHAQLVQWPGIFQTRLFKIKERHQYLKHLKRNQYDSCKENYISLKALVTKSDKEFCVTVAKSSTTEFNQFLKTL